MKNKTMLLILIVCIVTGKISGQTDAEKSIATYQLAQEAYDKGNYDNAIEYLNKVETQNPEAKVKTRYLLAKCYGNIFKDETTERYIDIYNNCMISMDYYFNNGKDENKKTEMLKIKISLQSSNLGKLILKFTGMTNTDAFNIIVGLMKKYSTSHVINSNESSYSWDEVNFKNCIFELSYSVWQNDGFGGAGKVGYTSINLSDAYFSGGDGGVHNLIKVNNTSSMVHVYDLYMKPGKYDKYKEEDINNYKNGINKTHGNKGYFYWPLSSINPFYAGDIIRGYAKISKDEQDTCFMAFRVLIKNCGGSKK